jgi:N-acetylmuramoyl-L-alanine amidase
MIKMKVKIARDKFIYLSMLVIFVLLIIVSTKHILSFKGTGNNNKNVVEVKSVVKLLSKTEDGNVSFQENEFFKKYKIKLSKEQGHINFEEASDFIKLTLEENEVANLNMNSFDDNLSSTIYKKDDSSDRELYIKKQYENNNFVYVDSREKNSIVVLISKQENPFKYKVLLDPGHGGIDVGASFGDLLEKNLNLKIIKYMGNDLRYNGCLVKFSREEDKSIKIEDVAKMANDMSADVLVSVHINDFDQSKYNGVETHYTFFTDNEEQNKNERIALAKILQKHAIKDDEWKDRGIVKDRLKLLRLSAVPCALVECGFISNPSDREKLQKEEVLMNFAKNIDEGILEFLSSVSKTP